MQQEVNELVELAASGPETARADCLERLTGLRALYARLDPKDKPAYFPGDTIRALQRTARLLEDRKPKIPHDIDLLKLLHDVFGHSEFRPGQEEIIRSVLAGKDCLAVMPTGGGKSLTYQLPARMMGGTTLVISPLIALMKDQVDALTEKGLHATYLNSSLVEAERRQRILDIRRGRYELVYAAPEGIEFYIGSLMEGVDLRLVAVDEAHCISEWGHDFRPAYRTFSGLKQRFKGVPMLALTATATKKVQKDILDQLGMEQALCFQGTFYRSNLKIATVKKGEGGAVGKQIMKLVKARKGKPGIIYCFMRKTVEVLAEALQEQGIKALAYHAGLETADRIRIQERFRDGEIDVMVATVAFGMGIDKGDIRFVIHRDMPRSLEGYAQEIGRAGRDGKESECILFFAWPDVLLYDQMTEGQGNTPRSIVMQRRRQVREMFSFADSSRCRHQALAAHFGEQMAPCAESCDACVKRKK